MTVKAANGIPIRAIIATNNPMSQVGDQDFDTLYLRVRIFFYSRLRFFNFCINFLDVLNGQRCEGWQRDGAKEY